MRKLNYFLLLAVLVITSCDTASNSVATCSGDTTAVSDATKAGALTNSETWSGTINVSGDVLVGKNCTLTIEPGTTVKFAKNSDSTSHGSTTGITDSVFPNDPAHKPSEMSGIELWGGTLTANGTARSPITFTSAAETKTAGDWQSITFADSSSTLSLKNTVIEYGYYGVQVSAAATDTNVTIQDNTIQQAVACGICTGSDTATYTVVLTLSGNTIIGCGHEGIDLHSNATVMVENNTITDSKAKFVADPSELGGNGVAVDKSASTIQNNTFLRNNQGIGCVSDGSNPTIGTNTFGTGADANDENVQTCPR